MIKKTKIGLHGKVMLKRKVTIPELIEYIKKHRAVSVARFGIFEKRTIPSRKFKNSFTGTITVSKKYIKLRFVPSRTIRSDINK